MTEEPKLITMDEFWDRYAEVNSVDPRKADCSKCKHRHGIPGNTHIACMAIGPAGFLKVALDGEVPTAHTKKGDVPLVCGKEIGIRKGYFTWPLNFDPVWLRWCLLFEERRDA